jgi:hypothetical protein
MIAAPICRAITPITISTTTFVVCQGNSPSGNDESSAHISPPSSRTVTSAAL